MKAPGITHKKNVKSVAFNTGSKLSEPASKQTFIKSSKYSEELNFANSIVEKLKKELAQSKEKVSCLEKELQIKTANEVGLQAELEALKSKLKSYEFDGELSPSFSKSNKLKLNINEETKPKENVNYHTNNPLSSRKLNKSIEKRGFHSEIKDSSRKATKNSGIEESFFNDPSRSKIFNLSNFVRTLNPKQKKNVIHEPLLQLEANTNPTTQKALENQTEANVPPLRQSHLISENEDNPLSQIISDYDVEVNHLESFITELLSCQAKLENLVSSCTSLRRHNYKQDYEFKYREKKSQLFPSFDVTL